VGLCEACELYMREHSLLPVDLFIAHIRRVLDYIQFHHHGLSVIMWDDMFRGVDLHVLQGESRMMSADINRTTGNCYKFIMSCIMCQRSRTMPRLLLCFLSIHLLQLLLSNI